MNNRKPVDEARPGHPLPANLAQPAQRALQGAGCATLEEVAALSEAEVKRLHGIGPKVFDQLRRALAEQGLAFATQSGRHEKTA